MKHFIWMVMGLMIWTNSAQARIVKPTRNSKTVCLARELKRKDCGLRLKKLKVGLFHDKWRFDDGKWLANQNIPVTGDHVEWKKAELKRVGSRWIVEMWIWGEPEGEARVQALNWLVLEIGDFSNTPRLQRVVQRRRVLPDRKIASGSATKKRLRFQFDPLEKHGLVLNRGKILWRLGREKGEF